MIFKKNSLIMVLSNDYRNDFTFQITCPSKLLTTYIGTYTHRCVPQLGLLNDRVESGNQTDVMVVDDHNPRREVAYGNSNIPSKS